MITLEDIRIAVREEIGDIRIAVHEEIGDIRIAVREEIEDIRIAVREEIGPVKKALDIVLSDILDPWAAIRDDSSSIGYVTAPKKSEICKFYNFVETHCMILGKIPAQHNACNIICAHIWPNHTLGQGLDIFHLEPSDLNSPRNFLRLQKELEAAFDQKKIMFIMDDNSTDDDIVLKVKLVDPSLRNQELTIQNHSGRFSYNIPWNNIDGLTFQKHFTPSTKPFLRLLSQHAHIAIGRAVRCGWMDADISSTYRQEAYKLARLSMGSEKLEIEAFRETA